MRYLSVTESFCTKGLHIQLPSGQRLDWSEARSSPIHSSEDCDTSHIHQRYSRPGFQSERVLVHHRAVRNKGRIDGHPDRRKMAYRQYRLQGAQGLYSTRVSDDQSAPILIPWVRVTQCLQEYRCQRNRLVQSCFNLICQVGALSHGPCLNRRYDFFPSIKILGDEYKSGN